MQKKDLEIFNDMPFLFFVKDEEKRYVWVNKAVRKFANEDVVGKTDSELIWAKNAKSFQSVDKEVLESGESQNLHEHVDLSGIGNTTLSVCKFVSELEGKKCLFGIGFFLG